MKKQIRKIGVITSGGDCSGLNTALRAVTFAAIAKGWEVFGIHNGSNGLIVRPMEYETLTLASFEFPFATLGGTMLGTNNSNIMAHDNGRREKIADKVILERFKEGLKN